jgi:hypothetical protein
MANDFRQVRIDFEYTRSKLNNGEKISKAELEQVKKYAAMNPSNESLTLYAIAKKSLGDNAE